MYNYYQQPPQQIRPINLKGRPVSSIEEVRATAVDFDGSIFYFPNLANDKIYTKQINLDGTSSIKVYELTEVPTPVSTGELVTKEEFNKTIKQLVDEIAQLKPQQPQQTFDF